MSERERVVDVETSTDPFGLIYGVKNIADSIRLLLLDYEDRHGGWQTAARDQRVRDLLLGQMHFAGVMLARITELVTAVPTAADEQRRALDAEIADARADVMQAALDVVIAGVSSARSSEAPPPK